MAKLKLGTRRSLLAWAQSSWVAREVERLNPGTSVELVGIDTRGDQIQDISLSQVEGKEFFVAELDSALSGGSVDFTVHSMKDLSLDRPAPFVLAAIPKRENPRDVIIYGPGVLEKLRKGEALKIGTSSPRRLENIPVFLRQALPKLGSSEPRVELVEIRGNVNTRLGRIHEPSGSERALDGVVLAFAGLIRLWADEAGRTELQKLLPGARWMILPLQQNPAAPAQGALAVECRTADAGVRAVLSKLHDPESARRVARERQLLKEWGGGCHQRFGATAVVSRQVGDVMYVRGRMPDNSFVDELRWNAPLLPGESVAAWDGSEHRANSESPSVAHPSLTQFEAVFVAHARALPVGEVLSTNARVWTSGVPSWTQLARRGVWVEGCAESLGFEFLRPTLAEKVLSLPEFGPQWSVLTHDRAHAGWGDARVVATYEVPKAAPAEAVPEGLAAARLIYWGSGSQFDLWGGFAAAGARHYCGPGKTAAHLRSRGIEPTVFPSTEEWRKWLKRS